MTSTEDRRTKWKIWAAGTIVTILLGLIAVVYADMRSDINKKADKEMVNLIREDVQATRAMMETHIMATGAGTLEVNRGGK